MVDLLKDLMLINSAHQVYSCKAEIKGKRARKDDNCFIGKKYNHLTVKGVERSENDKYNLFVCLCDCGNSKTIKKHHVLINKIKSCGCQQFLGRKKGVKNG